MRARTIIIISALVCAFAIPASASADTGYSSPNAITGGSDDSGQAVSGQDYSSLNAISPPVSESSSGYSSLNATTGPSPAQPTFASGSPSANDGFQWGDAALGAGMALALVAFGGAALLTVRRRTAVSPSGSAS
jgi:hypothetical protein